MREVFFTLSLNPSTKSSNKHQVWNFGPLKFEQLMGGLFAKFS